MVAYIYNYLLSPREEKIIADTIEGKKITQVILRPINFFYVPPPPNPVGFKLKVNNEWLTYDYVFMIPSLQPINLNHKIEGKVEIKIFLKNFSTTDSNYIQFVLVVED